MRLFQSLPLHILGKLTLGLGLLLPFGESTYVLTSCRWPTPPLSHEGHFRVASWCTVVPITEPKSPPSPWESTSSQKPQPQSQLSIERVIPSIPEVLQNWLSHLCGPGSAYSMAKGSACEPQESAWQNPTFCKIAVC